MLFQVVRLDELHATLAADVRPDVFVLHHVVLKLARILKRLLALGTPASTGFDRFQHVILDVRVQFKKIPHAARQ